MSFLYPRTVTITRPPSVNPNGRVGYGGLKRADEATVLTGLPASVQQRATGGATGAQLPSDARSNPTWRVFIPKRACRNPDAIRNRDVATDDLGRRFQVTAAYFNSLGFNLLTEQLEV